MSLSLDVGTYSADPVHSSVSFSIRHLGLARIRGSFTQFTAELTVAEDLAGTSVVASIDLDSVNTGNADRDAHMQGADFFNTEAAPKVTFRSTSIKEAGANGDLSMNGVLSMNSVTAPITLEGQFLGTSTFPLDQSQRAGFAFVGTLSRKAYGMEFDAPAGGDKLMLGDSVTLELDVEFVL